MCIRDRYKPFIESSGNKFVMVPADTESFQIDLAALESLVNEHTQADVTKKEPKKSHRFRGGGRATRANALDPFLGLPKDLSLIHI